MCGSAALLQRRRQFPIGNKKFSYRKQVARQPGQVTWSTLLSSLITIKIGHSKLLYWAPAWSGFCSAKDRTCLDAFLRRCRRLGYCGSDISTVAEMFDEAGETLFHRILSNNNHMLQSYLPGRSRSQYNLRTGAHGKELIIKTSQLNDRDFLYVCCTKDVTEHKTL